MLYIDHLTKTFGEKKAVDDLSLHIAPGEIYGFIGHRPRRSNPSSASSSSILAGSRSAGTPFRTIPSPARRCSPTSRITPTSTSL